MSQVTAGCRRLKQLSSAKTVNAGTSSRRGRERGLSSLLAGYSLPPADFQKGLKNISLEEYGINALRPLIGHCVTESLSRGIDSREKIDL